MADPRPAPRLRAALVTGATGFLGQHLALRLADSGVAVTAIVRPTSDRDRLAALPDDIRIHIATGDDEDLNACFARAQPDAVFHLAARFTSSNMPDQIPGLTEDNVMFTMRICKAAIATGCTALIAAGTAWQNAHNTTGKKPSAPNTTYAASKRVAESIIEQFCRMSDLNAITLKIYDSYGPNDPRRKFLAVLREAAATGKTLAASPGDQLLHMVHVDDLIDGFIHAGNLLAAGEIRDHVCHTLPSPKAVTLRALAEMWMSANDRQATINWGSRPHRDGEVMVPWEGDPLPGWHPEIDLITGLASC